MIVLLLLEPPTFSSFEKKHCKKTVKQTNSTLLQLPSLWAAETSCALNDDGKRFLNRVKLAYFTINIILT